MNDTLLPRDLSYQSEVYERTRAQEQAGVDIALPLGIEQYLSGIEQYLAQPQPAGEPEYVGMPAIQYLARTIDYLMSPEARTIAAQALTQSELEQSVDALSQSHLEMLERLTLALPPDMMNGAYRRHQSVTVGKPSYNIGESPSPQPLYR